MFTACLQGKEHDACRWPWWLSDTASRTISLLKIRGLSVTVQYVQHCTIYDITTGGTPHLTTLFACLCGLAVRVPGYTTRGHGARFPGYQIFWEVVGLKQGPFSLVSTTEELLGRKSSGSGLKNWVYLSKDQLCWPRNTLYPKKLALTSPTRDGRSVED
jgi:hypothetical protein